VLDGHEAIIVRSETRGDGLVAVFRHVRDELTTMIDLERGVPIKAEAVVEKGRSVRFVEAVFSDRGYRVTRRYGGSEPAKWEQSVPEGARAHDLHSTMAHVRLWDPEPGTRAYLYAQSGESFYRIDVVAAGVETLRTELGEVAARRVEGTATPYDRNGEPKAGADLRTFMAWFSTDEARVPLRIVADTTYGKVYAELANYQQPAGKALRLDHTSPAPAPD
jgi:hypothetical protein